MNSDHLISVEDTRAVVDGALQQNPVHRSDHPVGETPSSSPSPLPRQLAELARDQVELCRSHQEQKGALLRYLALFDLAPVGYVTLDERGAIQEINLTAAAMLGAERDSLFGQPFSALVHPDDIAMLESRRREELPSPTPENWEMRMLRRQGAPFWAQVQSRCGQNGEFWLVFSDISARKETDNELALKSFTLDNLAEEVIWLTADGTIWNVNQVACDKLGYSRQELLALSIAHINAEMSPEAWQRFWQELKGAGNLKSEATHRTREGRSYPVEIVSNYFNHRGREYCYAIVRDITRHKNLEQALQDSEEQFRTLCDSAPIGIFSADKDGNSILSNPRWEEIAGMSASECIGKGWTRAIHPDDREEQSRTWLEAMGTGRAYSHEYRLLTPQGKTVWVRALANPIKGPDDAVLGYVWTVEDITELHHSRQEILKAQKLESLGMLAGGIAHDFNNILTAILGNISLARLQLHDPHKVSRRLEEAETATSRAKELTRQLITFARGGEPVKSVIQVDRLLREAVGFALHGSNVRCDFTLGNGLWLVEADEGQLRQVIHNLVLNAVQAMPEGGTVSIAAENVISRQDERRFVKISITDTGVGIPAHHMQQIFDPYFSTKQQCNGLGLATCHSILKRHGGKIRAQSTLGRGSTFTVSLPALERAEEREAPGATAGAAPGRHLLVMDDEELIRELVAAILKEFGYSVECVDNGSDAVERYRTRMDQGAPFAAVILDLTIPGGVGGKEAMEQLRALDPAVKAIVSSGYSDDPVVANFHDYGFSAVLNKPYRPQEMQIVLRELLAQAP